MSSRARKKRCSRCSWANDPALSPRAPARGIPRIAIRGLTGKPIMKILVANLGSTSFKYRLFDMADERVLGRGGVERIGSKESKCFVEVAGRREETTLAAKNHAVAVQLCLRQLTDQKCLQSPMELAAIGFKAVHAQGMTGVQRVNDKVLA